MGSNIFVTIKSMVENALSSLENATLTDQFAWIQTAIVAIVGLMITYKGYQTLAGQSQQPIKELTWDISKKLLIMMFVLNTNGWLTQVNELCSAFYQWAGGGLDLYVRLDNLVTNFTSCITKFTATFKADNTNIAIIFSAILAIICASVGFLFVIFSLAFTLIMAEISNTLLIILAPLAFFCLMWGQTRQIFGAWLNLFISNLIVLIIYTLVFDNVIMRIRKALAVDIDYGSPANFDFVDWSVSFMLLCMLATLLIKMATDVARSLANVSLEAGMGSIMAGMAGATGAGFGIVSKLALNTPKKALDLAFGSKNTTTGKREGGLVGGAKGTYNFGKQAVNFTKSMLSKNDK